MLYLEINGYRLQQFSFQEALMNSGSSQTDDEMTQTLALNEWLKDRKWDIITDSDPEHWASKVKEAMDRGLDTLILKEN